VSLPLHTYDIVMIAVLIVSTVLGLWKGMAWQLAAFASLIVSAAAAMQLSGPLAPYIGLQAPLNRWVAMLLIYLVTALCIWILFRMVSNVVDRVRLKEFDRQMGGLLGLAKGVLWCLVITFFVVTLSEPLRQSVLDSRSGYYIALLIHRADPVMPEEIRAVLGKYIDALDEGLAAI
jgi:membrane protein required for colicin V production